MTDGIQAPDHAVGRLRLPEGVSVIEGSPNGARRAVGVVVGRFNGEITSKLLDGAIAALEEAVARAEGHQVNQVPDADHNALGENEL